MAEVKDAKKESKEKGYSANTSFSIKDFYEMFDLAHNRTVSYHQGIQRIYSDAAERFLGKDKVGEIDYAKLQRDKNAKAEFSKQMNRSYLLDALKKLDPKVYGKMDLKIDEKTHAHIIDDVIEGALGLGYQDIQKLAKGSKEPIEFFVNVTRQEGYGIRERRMKSTAYRMITPDNIESVAKELGIKDKALAEKLKVGYQTVGPVNLAEKLLVPKRTTEMDEKAINKTLDDLLKPMSKKQMQEAAEHADEN